MTRETDQSYEDALADLLAFVESPSPDDGPASPSTPMSGPEERTGEEPFSDRAEASEVRGDYELYFGSVDEFVREIITPIYQRKVGPRGNRRWSAEWWRSAEAISRLEALWRSWENLRLDDATGISTWWRDHADYHMNILFDPDGPFGRSEDENKPGTPLPYTPPPPGLFIDVRNDH